MGNNRRQSHRISNATKSPNREMIVLIDYTTAEPFVCIRLALHVHNANLYILPRIITIVASCDAIARPVIHIENVPKWNQRASENSIVIAIGTANIRSAKRREHYFFLVRSRRSDRRSVQGTTQSIAHAVLELN